MDGPLQNICFYVYQKFKMATIGGKGFKIEPYWKKKYIFFLRNWKFDWIQTVHELSMDGPFQNF